MGGKVHASSFFCVTKYPAPGTCTWSPGHPPAISSEVMVEPLPLMTELLATAACAI